MNADHSTQQIRKMIEEFRIPSSDMLVECLLADRSNQQSLLDVGIYISIDQSQGFYSNIFHFWVRSFFCFVESMNWGSHFQKASSLVECKEISTDEFRRKYLNLLETRELGSFFIESQQDPKTYIELKNRTFSQAYIVLDRPNIKSAVAESDGEYIVYFQTVPKANN